MKDLIGENVNEGSKTTVSLYNTRQGTVLLVMKRGSQEFKAELNVDKSRRLAGALKQAADLEQTWLIKKGGHIVGAM